MSRRVVCVAMLLVIQLCWCSSVEAQIGARIRSRRAATLGAPPAEPGAVAPAPYPPFGSLRGLLARRLQQRLDLVAQQEKQPTPAAPLPADQRLAAKPTPQPQNVARQVAVMKEPLARLLSLGEISRLDTVGLQNALNETQGQLLNELGRYSSAASWQGFLALPDNVLEDGALDRIAVETTLNRFDRVAGNPAYSQIASLTSFNQSRALLAELATRMSGPLLTSPTGDPLVRAATAEEAIAENSEPLPSPQPAERPLLSKGERSILVRSR